ncbi:hypothetical protein ACQ4PT_067670 [Festuca glaucescens]
MGAITSAELNFLVFCYLQESGFVHAAFTLGYEAGLHKGGIDGNVVPPGALITVVQKGLQYIELEANTDENDEEAEKDFALLEPLEIITKDVEELQRIVEKTKRERLQIDLDKDKGKEKECIIEEHEHRLAGHSSEVFPCAWSPAGSLLASGSGDSTARIWTIPDGPCGSIQPSPASVHVLKKIKGRTNEKSKDVTTLDWNGEGTLLATGSYDGQARIWSRDGELKQTLFKHKGPIFSLKWNRKGDCLLSGSVDKTAIVWDTKTWECKQQYEFHSAPTLDVDWRNNSSFATCSNDNMIYFCKIGDPHPVKTFSGHQKEVNAIKWDPTGSLLASCSDDCTAKIWSVKQDKCVYDFKEHSKEVYTIRWSPTGPGTSNPNQQLLLASASFDSSIKLWEVEQGHLLYSLAGHVQPVLFCGI